MRELSIFEVEAVSGCGIITNASEYIGAGIGMLLGLVIGNNNDEVTSAGANIGNGLGVIAEKSAEALAAFGKKAIKFLFW
ncbi:hypothetical protein ACFL9S_07530 [Erwinia sp. AnSW2-5]|uniref:hypothetical protein n=1 Tax=Erwinia sp. AnSW2-5 TaxID=3367692 RepID=UPI00385F217D